jgi:hypothetical protein
MQRELQATHPLLPIQLMGINEPSQEAGNESTTNGRDIPWLQDVDTNSNGRADAAMDLWNMAFRDVIILDGGNQKVGTYNLNQHNLVDSDNYATLKQMLIDTAMLEQKPWQNPTNPRDVDNSGNVVPLDVLLIVNELNVSGARLLPPPTGDQSPPPFLDTNGDGNLTPSDALVVINFLNSPGGMSGAEGEASFRAFGGLDDRPVGQVVLDDPLRMDGTFDQPGGVGQIVRSPALDDAARTVVIDRIFADELAADLEEFPHTEPDIDGLDLFSFDGGNPLVNGRG